MKKIYSLFVALACLVWSCDDKLDIVPKGQSTLSTLEDIELLLNQEIDFNNGFNDMSFVCNDSYESFANIPTLISMPNTLEYAYIRYDEKTDRAALTSSDGRYNALYKYINYMNVVIEKTAQIDGNEAVKARMTAEARIMRAYFHYLLVNIYGCQYDEATADKLGGVPYVTTTDVSILKEKLSVAEVYEKILEDCSDEVIAVLTDYTADVCRTDKAFGYGVRAKVLFQMKRYADAIEQAQKALKFNNNLEDRSLVRDNGSWNLGYESANNYMFIRSAPMRVSPCYQTMPPESVEFFDENDFVRKYAIDWFGSSVWSASGAVENSGVEGGLCYTAFGTSYNTAGIRTENMYYIIGESLIRTGKIRDGLDWFDRVRVRRIENPELWADAHDAHAMTEKEAMELVRQFSYIEFITGYDTFFNCKRWNSEPDYARSITRNLGEYGTFTVRPDSPLWIMPFPQSAVRYNSTLTQNYQ